MNDISSQPVQEQYYNKSPWSFPNKIPLGKVGKVIKIDQMRYHCEGIS